MNVEQQERAILLLDVTQKLMTKCRDSSHVENILEMLESWGGFVCDGHCLLEDINNLLEELEDSGE